MQGCVIFAVIALVFFFVLVPLLAIGIHFWYIAIPLILLGFILYKGYQSRERQKEEDAYREADERGKRAAEEARKQLFREEQGRYRDELTQLAKQSIDTFEDMPGFLSAAEQHLDQAEIDLQESAFAPFWDGIERAANLLGRFDEGLRRINENSSRYAELIKQYVGPPPTYPLTSISVSKLDVGTGTAARLKAIVRKAQRDFHFASIYEQRKTNQILVAGFTNLAQALDRMSSQITDSIDNLSSSVDRLSDTMEESTRTIDSRLGEIRDAVIDMHEDISEHQSEQAWREKKASEMLDNIQRGRKPLVEPSPFI
jgi:hypothetical protein